MGKEIVINILEEMCDLMCDNKEPTKEMDSVDRQAVNTLVDELARAISDERCCISRGRSTATIMQDILDLPPVTSQPKTGHWIMPVQDDGMSDPIYYQVRCSECGFDLYPQTWHLELHQYDADKYCPNCGAKMESEVRND